MRSGVSISPVYSKEERASFDHHIWTSMRPFNSSILWTKNVQRKKRCSCTKLEFFLLLLTSVLLGLILICVVAYLMVFNGFEIFGRNMDDILSVSSSIAIDSSATHNKYKVCTSRECAKIAAFFASNLDEKIDPCSNMYEFACKNYKMSIDKSNFHSTIADLQLSTFKRLRNLLEEPIKENDSDKLSKLFYSKCVDETAIDQTGREAILGLLEKLGGWPILSDKWKPFSSSWEVYLADVVNKTGISSIIIDSSIHYDPLNSSNTVIELDQPKFEFNLPFLSDEDNLIHDKYMQLIIDIIHKMSPNLNNISQDVMRIVKFERNLSKFASDEMTHSNPDHTNNRFLLHELKELFPNLDLNLYIRTIFKGIAPINDNDTIIVREVNYFRAIQDTLKVATKRDIANYIGWRIIHTLNPFLPKSDRHLFQQHKSKQAERWEDCLYLAISLLDLPIGKMLVNSLPDKEYARSKARQIITHLKSVFIEDVKRLKWLKNEAREKIVKKVKNVSYLLGFPDKIPYDWNFTPSNESIFDLTLKIKRYKTSRDFSRYKQKVNRDVWHQSPAQVDAFYSPNLNQITIPAAIMQFPFLLPNVPDYIVFSMLGTIIAHEFAHAFCSHGSKFDQDGNLKVWWDKETLKRYREKTQCFLKQYDNAKRFNDQFYLSENLADNIAIKFAYKAYNEWQRELGEVESALPGFQNYTNEQMFFLAYSNNWCSSTMESSYHISDSHSSFSQRATLPLQNLEYFSDAFSCPPNSQMNPMHKCSIF